MTQFIEQKTDIFAKYSRIKDDKPFIFVSFDLIYFAIKQ